MVVHQIVVVYKLITKTTWIIIIVFYLVILGTIFGYVGSTFGDANFYSSVQKTIGVDFIANIVTGVKTMPVWLNTLLIGIPFGMLIYILVSNSTPTTNSGA